MFDSVIYTEYAVQTVFFLKMVCKVLIQKYSTIQLNIPIRNGQEKIALYSLSIGAPGTVKLGPGGIDSPHFLMAQDRLWNSEEKQRG